jgi:hypothetical protein
MRLNHNLLLSLLMRVNLNLCAVSFREYAYRCHLVWAGSCRELAANLEAIGVC